MKLHVRKWLSGLCLILVSPVFSLTEVEMTPEEENKAYNTYIEEIKDLNHHFAEQMKEEYGLALYSSSTRGYGVIRDFALRFNAKRRATKDEARALHFLVMEKFLEKINSCEKIRPFLKRYPFTHGDVVLSIYFSGINGQHADGTVADVSNSLDIENFPERNCIFYYIEDPCTFNSVNTCIEPREEAIAQNLIAAIQNPAIHEVSAKEEAIDLLFCNFRKQMAKKHRYGCISIGGKMTGDIEEVGAHFLVVRHASQEEARALILDLAQNLIKTINSDSALQPYLAEDPFPIDRLRLYLGFRKKNHGTYTDGSMESVMLEGGKVSYFQEIPHKKGEVPGVIPCHVPLYAEETYQDALRIIEQTPEKNWCKRLLSKFLRTRS